jgi:hypothetical protein
MRKLKIWKIPGKILSWQIGRVQNCMILVLLTGCIKNTGDSDFCAIYQPVFPDYSNDTVDTIKQIDENNVVYDEICKFYLKK